MKDCPSPDTLQRLLDEALPEEECRALEPHLEACPDCRAILDELTNSSAAPWPSVPVTGPTPWLGSATSALDYRLVRYRARGGLGEVFEVRDDQFRRPVALKVLREQHHADPECRRRFLEEAQITARLEHPGIVPVHALAQANDGRPGYVMRLIQGETLQEAIRKFHQADPAGRDPAVSRLALRRLLAQFIAVCNTVAYAHSQQVLHRDIKPSNIMLGPFGEALLLDWGLAKDCAEEAPDPSSGAAVAVAEVAAATPGGLLSQAAGTPGFMSPEQAAGPGAEVGPASDIYSLGATLYCLLTAQPPFPSPGAELGWDALAQKIQQGDFPTPRTVNPKLHPDLEAVCLKALALRPEDRYPSALALAADVEQCLADEAVSAKRSPPWLRVRRWLKRNQRWVTPFAAAALVVLAASAVAAPVLLKAYAGEREARGVAEAEKARADEQRARADANLARAVEARKLEEKQRARAEANVERSIRVMDFFLERLRIEPALTLTQKNNRVLYLSRLTAFYKQLLADQEGASPKARLLIGRAYHGLGSCYALEGKRQEAEGNFLKAQAVQEKLKADAPDLPLRADATADLVITLSDLALLYRGWGRPEAAAAARKQLEAFFDFSSSPKQGSTYQIALRVARRFHDLGEYEESLIWQGKVIDGLEAQLRAGREGPEVRKVLGMFLSLRAMSLIHSGQLGLGANDLLRRVELLSQGTKPKTVGK
jgi:serine/threonine protein kinase